MIIAALAVPVHAEKLYKTKDADGNITFSQYPPEDQGKEVITEDLTVEHSSKSAVTEGLHGTHCGQIKLPDQAASNYSHASYMKNLDRTRSSWQAQLASLNKTIDLNNQNAIKNNQASSNYGYRNNQYSADRNRKYHESIATNGEKLRDLRCAIGWADGEIKGTSDYVASRTNERARLTKIRDDLQKKLNTSCGQIPAYDPRLPSNEMNRKRWYDCSDSLRRKIDLVQGEINKI